MSEIIQVADLEKTKFHNTFHVEAVTGKEGGLAAGADIDYTTNAVTGQVQKTLPKILDDIDWSYVGLFADVVTFTKSTDFAVDDSGIQWIYTGTYPFTTEPETVPSEPLYQVVHVRDHNSFSNRNAADAHPSSAISTPDGNLNDSLAHRITSEFNSDDKHFISCIPRVSAGGVLSLLNDTDHETLGFSSVSQVGDFIMRINYTNSYTQVNSLSITIDDALCKYGVFTGGSVGTAYTDFTAYAQLSGLIDATALTFTGSGLFPDGIGVAVSYVDDILIIDHDNNAFLNDACVVTQRYALGTMVDFGVSQNASQINIIPYTELAGCLIYNGTSFVIDPSKPWGVSTFQAGVTFAWDNTVNALKVTHPVAKDYLLQVTPSLGGYASINAEPTSLTTFHVYFFSVSGVQLTSPNTNMKINFERAGCQVRGIIPFGAKFHMRAGMTPIRSANLGSVSGNNFWVNGVMQKKV